MTDAFLDTNILVYLLSDDTAKADRAEALLREGGTVSVQVLNEFANVARRKIGAPWPIVGDLLATFGSVLKVEAIDLQAHERAIDIAERYQLNIYDAQILASAQLAGCSLLYSEDMQDGLAVDDIIRVRNPFAA